MNSVRSAVHLRACSLGLKPSPGRDGLRVVDWSREEAPLTISVVSGVAGSAIVRVEFRREGQPPIVASLANGWFAAWTYDFEGATTIRGFDTAGNEVAAIEP